MKPEKWLIDCPFSGWSYQTVDDFFKTFVQPSVQAPSNKTAAYKFLKSQIELYCKKANESILMKIDYIVA